MAEISAPSRTAAGLANGSVTPQPFAAQLAVHADEVALALAQPYVSEHANLSVEDGRLELDGKLALAPQAGDPKLSLAGDVTLKNLRTVDDFLHQDFIAFEQLELKQLKYESQPASLDVGRIELRKPFARVVLSADEQLNVVSVLARSGPGKSAAPAGEDYDPFATIAPSVSLASHLAEQAQLASYQAALQRLSGGNGGGFGLL